MSGSKALVKEIMENHYSNIGEKTASKDKPIKIEKSDQSDGNVRKKRKYTKKTIKSDTSLNNVITPSENGSMYTMSIVGAIGIPDYKLNAGEKLVIVKLSPTTLTI